MRTWNHPSQTMAEPSCVHGSESWINHQLGSANQPSGQRGFLLAHLSPPARKPSERTLGAVGDEAPQFGSDCKHKPQQLPPLQGQPACAWVLHISPSQKESTFPQQHIWRCSRKTCWAAQAITENSDSFCISPSLDIVELQLLLLWRSHVHCLHLCPSKGRCTPFAAQRALAGSTAAQWQPPLVCQIP